MNNPDYLSIGSRIRRQRELLGYTREFLAEQLAVSTNFCRDIEIGAKGMSLKTLINISMILNISTDYILFGQENENSFEPIINMLKSCNKTELKYLTEIIKYYVMSHRKKQLN
ncbi:MAG TPA: helix-turn-helix transcriptional regulator [Candidatus Monoglobus merdigallinarum]|uniref:Helix-turn-helix transcriptional regulator n=1 Tax=Candidatus Monoglobus merdigallinarum TaxID=2838698 RepID=A0A9D1TMN0_9FIRM|nr:helix-turn-helix transcriptional regulator [Candidatus Monoglobus merdigallinarum]